MQSYLPILVYVDKFLHVGEFLHLHKLSCQYQPFSKLQYCQTQPVSLKVSGKTLSSRFPSLHSLWIKCILKWKQFISHKKYLIGHLYKVFNPLKQWNVWFCLQDPINFTYWDEKSLRGAQSKEGERKAFLNHINGLIIA